MTWFLKTPRPGGRQEFAVLGLGRFGASVARTLVETGHSVLGADRDPAVVQQMADQITQTVALDTTDEDALRAVDIGAYPTVVVAMGQNFEGNLLTVTALKTLGVPTVISKALTERQKAILLRVGADRVVLPESEAGGRLARELATPDALDPIVFGPDHGVQEVPVPPPLAGRTLREADLRRRYGVSVLAVRRADQMNVSPPSDYRLTGDDRLLVLGAHADLARLAEPTAAATHHAG